MSDEAATPEPRPRSLPWYARAVLLLVGAVGLWAIQAYEGTIPRAPLLALLPLSLFTWAVLSLLPKVGQEVRGLPPSWDALPGEPRWRAPVVTVPVAFSVLVGGGLALPASLFPWLILGAIAALIPSALRRPGVFVFAVVAALYAPKLGTYTLWDPWETHYGEVAREILSRQDWISLWWAQENWFWSKPILIFWSEAFTMGALGVNPLPDANPAHPEWAIRLPLLVISLGAVMATYAAVRARVSARAGVFAALALATFPHFFFLAHQAITDMYFIAPLTVGVMCLALAVTTDPDAPVRVHRVGPFALSLRHALLAATVAWVGAVSTYLVSRNLTFTKSLRVWVHPDTFVYGSAGNGAQVPGNAVLRDQDAFVSSWAAEPAVQGLLWLALLALLLWLVRREMRTQAWLMHGFYLAAALGLMGKGIPGVALPGLVSLLYLVVSGRWGLLTGGHLRIARGILTTALVGVPWFVAMYMRHGPRFTDRLLIHDHINRLASGVHGDTGSLEYFLEQMGYGMFPWVALVPVAVTVALRAPVRSDVSPAEDGERTLYLMLTLWFFAAFTLFNVMVTKFHHYIAPAEPPAAMLAGLLLHRALGELPGTWRARLGLGVAGVGGVLLAVAAALFRGDLRGIVPEAMKGAEAADWVLKQAGSPPAVAGAALAAALFLVGAGVLLAREARAQGLEAGDAAQDPAPHRVGFLLGALLVAGVGYDLASKHADRPYGFEKLLQLFVYNYKRAWPEHLDYRAPLFGFAVAAVVLVALLVAPKLRRVVAPAFLGLAVGFSAWTVNVYMTDVSPHWGQAELIRKYYATRGSAAEPLLAYQMNWKGENFYTGNRAFVFVKVDTKLLKEWITKNPKKRIFAILEHGRVSAFRGHLRGGKVTELTTKRQNNKFVLLEATTPG